MKTLDFELYRTDPDAVKTGYDPVTSTRHLDRRMESKSQGFYQNME